MDKGIMEARLESRRRNGHKRHSGVYGSTGQAEYPRTNSKTHSGDRNGQIYPDDFPQTIRAITPDPPLATDIARPASALGVWPNARNISPRRAVRRNLRQTSGHTTPQSGDVTPNSGAEVRAPSSAGSKISHHRPRTRTLEERVRDKSPPALLLKHRHRVGSLQATTAKDFFEDTSSIGFPSIIPSPPLESDSYSHRRRLAKPPPRPLTPVKNPSMAKRSLPQSSPATDATKILNLMKTTCGRMHGIISFRTSSARSWSSGYCAINVGPGSLIYQNKGDVSQAKTLISDLRGCHVRTLYDGGTRSTFLDVSPRGATTGIHLRPHVPEAFDSWLAALLCWQPIRPKGVQNKMTKPQEPMITERRPGDRRRNSAITSPKDAAIIKVGKVKMWNKYARSDIGTPMSSRRASVHNPSTPNPWQRVSCTLQENGHFKLFTETDVTLLTIILLSSLSRCSIQRLNPSVLDDEFSLAIYPQYTSSSTSPPTLRTVYLSMESRVLFEVWFVLLRAFTVPDLYGPEQVSTDPQLGHPEPGRDTSNISVADMFRVERTLSLRVTEAKLYSSSAQQLEGSGSNSHYKSSVRRDSIPGNYYAEVRLDGEVRAKTAVKAETSNPFWREEFDFPDLPPVLSSASIHLRTRNPGQIDWTLIPDGTSDHIHEDINLLSLGGNIELSPLDLTYGKVDLRLDDLDRATDTEKWWPVSNGSDDVVGEVLMKVRIEELVVLAAQDYSALSELLHAFSNGLTNQIAQRAHAELRRLSEIMLNIFQVSAQASDWIMSLVEDEIDNIHKESPVSRFRYGHRIASNDSFESGIEREVLVRDLGKSATVEANLLFRGNSLLTKALDLHMRRLGKEYLEETLSERMRDINESDPECEVDPNRVRNPEDLQRNWRNLIALTETVWRAIAASASRCPPELRMIFRHIRACAEDRYGDFLRTVAYSSVSGFLFLRFFCPAVLNPKLFDLLKGWSLHKGQNLDFTCVHKIANRYPSIDHPRPRAQRTLTLITKALQTLANLTTFGSKEPWMEPMNAFLNTHRQEFRDFVDTVCAISPDQATSVIPPSYTTPILILQRLPPTSREGFPSLPYLIDAVRECAALVAVWLDGSHETEDVKPLSEELVRFDFLCQQLRQKTKDCLNLAEQAERPNGALTPKWEELVEQMGRKARIRNGTDYSSPGTPDVEGSLQSEDTSTASLDTGYFHRDAVSHSSHRYAISAPSTAGSGIAEDVRSRTEDDDDSLAPSETPPGSSSAHWDPSTRAPGDETSTTPEPDSLNEGALGSSMYSLDALHKHTNSAGAPPRAPRHHHHQHRKSPRGKGAYSISGQRVEVVPTTPRRPSTVSRNDSIPGKSLYRLQTGSDRKPDPALAAPKSPVSKDGTGAKLRFGDFGGVFKRKGREREERS